MKSTRTSFSEALGIVPVCTFSPFRYNTLSILHCSSQSVKLSFSPVSEPFYCEAISHSPFRFFSMFTSTFSCPLPPSPHREQATQDSSHLRTSPEAEVPDRKWLVSGCVLTISQTGHNSWWWELFLEESHYKHKNTKFPSLYNLRSSMEERNACLGAIMPKHLSSSDVIWRIHSDKKKLWLLTLLNNFWGTVGINQLPFPRNKSSMFMLHTTCQKHVSFSQKYLVIFLIL